MYFFKVLRKRMSTKTTEDLSGDSTLAFEQTEDRCQSGKTTFSFLVPGQPCKPMPEQSRAGTHCGTTVTQNA